MKIAFSTDEKIANDHKHTPLIIAYFHSRSAYNGDHQKTSMGNLIQSSQTQLATKIVKRVSELEETDPLDLPPLYNSIDPEALDRLADSNIRFEYVGYTIEIENGTIAIEQ